MSMTLSSSIPGSFATVQLPNPDLGNGEGRDISVAFRRSMNGERYSYVKASEHKTFSFTWSNMGRGKLVEVQEFYKLFAGETIRLIDFRDAAWDVVFSENPIVVSVDKRSFNSGGARKESGSLTLEFKEVSR